MVLKYGIIADSSCDLTVEEREQLGIISIPLGMSLGAENFIDDDNLDIDVYMQKMLACKEKIGSSCPSPGEYAAACEKNDVSFIITLSAQLSGSYASAVAGARIAEEEGKEVYVFDSKSASAGEILIALKVRELIDSGAEKEEIIAKTEQYIAELKTFFVLDSIDNFVKNGRMGKIAGKIISVLGVKPVLGSDGEGNISLYGHARNKTQIVDRLTAMVEKSKKSVKGITACITHCYNEELAAKLSVNLKKVYGFGEILIYKTRGLSSMYCNNKGVILCF